MKLIAMTALLLPMAGAAEAPRQTAQSPAPVERAQMPNAHAEPANCLPLVRQVAGEKRAPHGTRLGDQPPAQLLLAVDRQVDGCREPTIIRRGVGSAQGE